jgi:hypothetical protein
VCVNLLSISYHYHPLHHHHYSWIIFAVLLYVMMDKDSEYSDEATQFRLWCILLAYPALVAMASGACVMYIYIYKCVHTYLCDSACVCVCVDEYFSL